MKLLSFYRRIPLIYLNLGAFIAGCLAGLIIYQLGICKGEDFLKSIIAILSQSALYEFGGSNPLPSTIFL